jgi:hypothetical protein
MSAHLSAPGEPESVNQTNELCEYVGLSENGRAALRYTENGWHVLPVYEVLDGGGCACGDPTCKSVGKHPRVSSWRVNASTDRREVLTWWQQWPDANVGIATGKCSNLVVIDVDTVAGHPDKPDGLEAIEEFTARQGPLPDTARVMTGSGGFHYYFSCPSGGDEIRNSTDVLPGIDVRGEGGYVIAPPSSHACGGVYTWANPPNFPDTDDIEEIPTWLVGMIFKPKSTTCSTPIELQDDSKLPRLHDVLYRNDPKYRDTCDFKRTDLTDRSASGHCFALIHLGLNYGFAPEEISAILLLVRTKNNAKPWDKERRAKEIGKVLAEREASVTSRAQPLMMKRPEADIPAAMTLRELASRPDLLTPPEAVIPSFAFRGRITVLAALPKAGKSTLMRSLVADASNRGTRVLWVRLEENAHDTNNAFVCLGANPDNVILTLATHPDLDLLDRLIEKHSPDLVVIDTLSAWFCLNGVTDENASAQVAPIMLALTGLTHRTGIALMLLFHTEKSGKQYRGSTAIAANTDVLMTMTVGKRKKTQRDFEPLARFSIEAFTMEFDGTHYYLPSGTPDDPVERAYRVIVQNPGIGMRDLRRKAMQDSRATDSAVDSLKAQGRVENREDEAGGHHYHPTLDTPAHESTHMQHTEDEDEWNTVLDSKPQEAPGKHTSSTVKKHTESHTGAAPPPDPRSGGKHGGPQRGKRGMSNLPDVKAGCDMDALIKERMKRAFLEGE